MIKYLRVASDFHLEGFYGRDYESLVIDFLPSDPRDKDSILVLAGDISSKSDQLIGFLRCAASNFAQVLFVPGNHELYRHDYSAWHKDIRVALNLLNQELQNKIVFVTDDVLEYRINDLRFILCTLWGDGGKTVAEHIRVDHGLNDFRVIRNGQERFKVKDMIAIHKAQKIELERLLKTEFTGKTVVCTHHMPSYRLCHPRFGNEINGGFASNCDDILAYDHAPSLWVFGHTHDRISTKLWKTQLECNPAGYRGEWGTEHNTFHLEPVFISIETLA